MNKLRKLVGCMPGPLQLTVRRNASHGHHVEKPYEPSNAVTKFLTKHGYWDNQPVCADKTFYRMNYGIPGGLNLNKKQKLYSELYMGIMWGWIFWHLFHEYEHLTGHYHPPDPSQWSDAELGVPPDDVE